MWLVISITTIKTNVDKVNTDASEQRLLAVNLFIALLCV